MVPCAQPAPFQSLSSRGKDGEEGGERRPRASAADDGPRGRPALRLGGAAPDARAFLLLCLTEAPALSDEGTRERILLETS